MSETTWFSRYFGIEQPQYELPFVDFSLTSDVPLYIDSYAITKDPSDLAGRAHNAILSYFNLLLKTIVAGDTTGVRMLIRGHLAEPPEIHLGVSKIARGGRGIGARQEQHIVEALTSSTAARVGAIRAIQELELHIPGIGPDKISDLIANIILAFLAEFTEEVCAEYGIATQPCAVNGFWNQDRLEWDGGYFNLPVSGTHSYILVPKRWIRREKDLMNHRDFYEKYVLDVLERELISANDSLVRTLKTGARQVTKKAMREDPRFRPTKDFISKFIVSHPEVIEAYRHDLEHAFNPADPAFWSGKAAEDDPKIADALARLGTLETGRKHATDYHDTVYTLLKFVFDWALENFTKEQKMDRGRSRIDIVADNYATGGLFFHWRNDFNAGFVPMECKNYGADLGNEEYNQLIDRLGPKSSRIGILFCRTITDTAMMLQHRSDRWLRHDVVILLIDDARLKQLTALRLQRDVHAIEAILRAMVTEVQLGAERSN